MSHKPKFSVGQVVVVREGYRSSGELRKIVKIRRNPFRYDMHNGFIAMECALRPLTKREKGRP